METLICAGPLVFVCLFVFYVEFGGSMLRKMIFNVHSLAVYTWEHSGVFLYLAFCTLKAIAAVYKIVRKGENLGRPPGNRRRHDFLQASGVWIIGEPLCDISLQNYLFHIVLWGWPFRKCHTLSFNYSSILYLKVNIVWYKVNPKL